MTPGVSRGARARAYLVGLVVSVGLFGVAMRAWALQIDDGERYRALAERQHAMRLDTPAPRGDVVDAHGRPLAVSADADSIWANPHDVRDLATTAEKLAAILHGDASALEAKLAGDHRFVWIERHVNAEVARAVLAAKLPGIEVAREPRRWYPARAIAGPVIGRADIDGKGLDGIELAMNDVLVGKRSAIAALRDARGHTMLAEGVSAVESGATVHLSLDRSIQAIAESALETAVAVNKPKAGVVVVLEVGTGRVLAMASYPTYDPNTGESHGARNLPVTDAFEAGSVMKVFSIATALEDGVVAPDTELQLGGSIKVGSHTIHDVHVDPYLDVSGIIRRSSNVGAAKIALRLGREKLYAGLKQFGFGAKTGIELPGERVGMLRNGDRWRDVETATISFGYGLTVTPLQVAAAFASIANHGVYREPRIVDEVVDGDGTVTYRGEGKTHQAVSAKTADTMMTMLTHVFDKDKPGRPTDGGTAKDIDVVGFKCAGKTGTANKYDPTTKQYAPDHYMSSFAGLAPAVSPRLAIVVMIDDPMGGNHYGGTVAGPVFATVASEGLRYLGVPGDPAPTPAAAPAPARPIAAPKLPEITAPVAEPVDPAAIMIPSFAGMGVRRALDLARSLHLPVEVIGSGRVVVQDPPAGPAVGANRLVLRFADEIAPISPPH